MPAVSFRTRRVSGERGPSCRARCESPGRPPPLRPNIHDVPTSVAGWVSECAACSEAVAGFNTLAYRGDYEKFLAAFSTVRSDIHTADPFNRCVEPVMQRACTRVGEQWAEIVLSRSRSPTAKR